MEADRETQIKKFKIIEPFLRKEKKLKDIEKETGVSYATLKRWIKSYKENGIIGLDKKERQDKNSFRAVDEAGINIIKKLCKESEEHNISELYDKCKNYLEEKEYNISYPTFYRIVNNLDGFFKKTSRLHMKKIKKENEVYVAVETSLYILLKLENGDYIVPKMIVIFDASSLQIINYMLYLENSNIYGVLGFLRKTILKVSLLEKDFIKPKEILLSCTAQLGRDIAKEIYDKTAIKILEYKSEEKKIDDFIEFLKEDMYKFYISNDKKLDIKMLKEFIDSYIYLDSGKYSTDINLNFLEKSKISRELDVFLQPIKRKINFSSLRIKNKIYKDEILKNINGEEVEIRFDPLENEKIYIFKDSKFYGMVENIEE